MATEFDYGQLDAITGGDAEFEQEVLSEYLASAPRDVEKLRAAVAAGNAPATGAAAHALKGASATIGAKGFAALALELELAGKRNEMANAPRLLAHLESEFDELVTFIRRRLVRAA